MGYSCEMDDPPSAFVESARTARLRHRCSECNGYIEPGEIYLKTWGVWGGEPESFKTCPACTRLREWVQAHIPCFCWNYTDMRSDARDAVTAVLEDEFVPGMWVEFARLYLACRKHGAAGRAERAALKGGNQNDIPST